MPTEVARHRPRVDVRFNQAFHDRVDALRQRVVGTPSSFGVEGVYVNSGVTLIVYGEINRTTLPRLETILDGLLLLRPSHITVEIDGSPDLDSATRAWIARSTDGIVGVCARPEALVSARDGAAHPSSNEVGSSL